MKKTFLWVAACILLLPALSGCSGHPGAGNWQASDGGPEQFARLQVHFDGKADFHYTDDPEKELRCYWQASAKDAIDLVCSHTGEEADKFRLELLVIGESQGELRRDGRTIARFDR